MEHNVLEEFREILLRINNYYKIYKHNIQTNYNSIQIIYEYAGSFFPDNFLNTYNILLTSKIYKYKDVYWNFGSLEEVQVYSIDNVTTIKFQIKVVTYNMINTYFIILPRELIDIITGYLGITDINNFCTYMKSWEDYCNERLYMNLYRENFPGIYEKIQPFLNYDKNSWRDRYTSLLWEDVGNLQELYNKYKFVRRRPTQSHIAFLLEVIKKIGV